VKTAVKLRHSAAFLALALLFLAMTASAAPIPAAAPAVPAASTEVSAISSVLDACESKSDSSLQIAMASNLSWLRFGTSQALGGGTCGNCSETICQGQAINAFCNFDGQTWYVCLNVLGGRCGPSGQNCSCVPAGTPIP
jgi:hypothetical protein